MKTPESLQKASFFVHGTQGLFVFIVFIICLIIKAQKGNAPYQTNFMFAMCFLSVPAIIYLAMTPRFPRTVKFANPMIMLVVGVIFTIMWFSAFVAVAAINQNGINGGKSNSTSASNSSGTCATTTIGTEKTCEIAKAAIGFGAITFLLFVGTTAIAGYTVHYLWSNSLPFDYYSSTGHTTADLHATTGDAFSHKDDPEDDAGAPGGPTTNYALLSNQVAPQRYEHDQESQYSGYSAGAQGHGYEGGSHPGYDVNETAPGYDENEPVEFPQGPYERGGRREY